MGRERRRYERLEVECPAQCAFVDSFPESFPVMIADVNPQGIRFISGQDISAGETIFITINLGDDMPVKFVAKVRWSGRIANTEQFQCGARFDTSNPRDLDKFVRFYCQRLAPAQRERKKILVIEPDDAIIRQVKAELAKDDYTVCAAGPEEGVAKYQKEMPDMILLDIDLPENGGFKIFRAIRKLQGDLATPILLLSEREEDAGSPFSHLEGVQAFFRKPLNPGRLPGSIRKLFALAGG